MKRSLLLFFLIAGLAASSQAQNTISTVAGGNPLNGTNPTATGIEGPYGIVRDGSGNLFVLTDQGIIYKVTPGTTAPSTMSIYSGSITAGYTGDGGPASAALLNQPFMGALDASGNLYFSDAGNCVVREINAKTQIITTVAGNGVCGYSGDGGAAKSAEFNNPQGIAFDGAGNMYVVDCENFVIRKINTSGVISTYAGVAGTYGYNDNVTALQATFNTPEGIASDTNGNLYIADTYNSVIRYINANTLIVSTFAGTGQLGNSGDGGPAADATMQYPFGVTLDGQGNVYIADTVNAVIRKVDANNTISTIIGNYTWGFTGDGGPALQAGMSNPYQIAVDSTGDVWTTDYWNARIRFYNNNSASGGYLTLNTVVGNGSVYDGGAATQASLHFPRSPELDASGNLYITDTQNNLIREVNSTSGDISTVAGTILPCPHAADVCGDGGSPTDASFYLPRSIAFDATGDLIVFDTYDSRVREMKNGVSTTIAGNGTYGFSGDGGPATSAELSYPWAGGYDAAGNLYILDAYNNRVRKIATNGNISTVAGSGATGCGAGGYSGDGGPATSATLNCPIGLDVDAAGNLYISDYFNFVVRKVDAATQIISTIAGTPGQPGYSGDGGLATAAKIAYADRVSVNAAGNLFISDAGNNVIRRVDFATGIIETFAGNGKFGFAGDGGPALSASFAGPTGVVVTNAGDLYVGDIFNNRVRKVTLTPGATLAPATVPFGNQQQGSTSAAQTVTLTDSGDAPLTISGVSITGDFAIQTNNCTATLATGASCTILVTFTPTSTGSLTGVLTATDNAASGTQAATLTGTGTTATANPALSIAKSHTGNFTQGQANAAYTVTVSNAASAGPTSGAVTVTETLPSGLTLVSMAGTGWTCALIPTCTRTDGLGAGASYPTITVTVNVGGSAPSPQVNAVSVSGGGSATANTTDSTTINAATGVTWANTGSMSQSRAEHTATLLNNSNVLVTGGLFLSSGETQATTGTAEIYNASTGTWATTGTMTAQRSQHAAALLTTGATAGQVLVTGGVSLAADSVLATAELFNPATGTFTATTGNMTSARYDHTATVLQNGEVLITGGRTVSSGGAAVASAELFNPATGTFTATGSMTAARFNHTATLLGSGMVLITGGKSDGSTYLDTGELYNPTSGTFTAITSTMSTPREAHTATLLQDGTVLIAGGGISTVGTITVTGSADIYNATANSFTPTTGSLSVPRGYHTATLLSNGTVVLAGGGNSSDPSVGEFQALSSVEIYNPTTKTFSFGASLNFARGYDAATLLNTGAVLTEGGFNGTNQNYTILASSERYTSSGTPAPVASLSPTTLTFASQSIGTTSAAQTVTLTNTGNAALTISSISTAGADTADFAETNTCPASLAANANCTISVTFKPAATGTRTANVSVADNATGSPQSVPLTGTGASSAGPAVTLAPPNLTFASQNLGTSSAPQSVTLTNSGSAALTITGISIAGTNTGDYSETNTCPASLAANANCTISVTFKPTATGARTANVSVADNATGSPQSVPLTGTGASNTAPAVTFAPTNLTFASQNVGSSSAPQSVTLTNSGNAALTITGVSVSGANAGDFSQTNTCPASLAANANCTISVTFKPTAAGARAASVSVADNATGSPQAVALTGIGATTTPTLTVNPTSLTFSSQTVGTPSAPLSVTVANTGTSPVQFTGFAIAGANSGDYVLGSGTCNSTGTLAAGTNCTIAVIFTPAAAGARTAALSIADNATESPQAVTLTGTGVASEVIVTVPPGGSTTATSVPGGTAYFGLVLTSAPGVTGTVTLGCTPSSPTLTCTVVPSTVTLTAGGKTEVAFGVQTYCQGTTASLFAFGGRGGFNGLVRPMLLALLSLLMGAGVWMARRDRRLALAFAMVMLIVLGSAACSGGLAKGPNGATPAGTYSLTLTTTFNGQTQTLPNYLTLIVN
jgi:Abnormal spindle-like microcephaly-assoc'd, ASPM-SPD-2-Hydin/Galactose oxidase, central domain/NHL repeat